jgi:hypothetical protein
MPLRGPGRDRLAELVAYAPRTPVALMEPVSIARVDDPVERVSFDLIKPPHQSLDHLAGWRSSAGDTGKHRHGQGYNGLVAGQPFERPARKAEQHNSKDNIFLPKSLIAEPS